LITRKHSLAYERYSPDHDGERPHEIRSAAKSIGSVLIGIALDQCLVSGATERVLPYFEERKPAGRWVSRATISSASG
jgi:hypothetical protein